MICLDHQNEPAVCQLEFWLCHFWMTPPSETADNSVEAKISFLLSQALKPSGRNAELIPLQNEPLLHCQRSASGSHVTLEFTFFFRQINSLTLHNVLAHPHVTNMACASFLWRQEIPPFHLFIPANIEEEWTSFLNSLDGLGGGEHFCGVGWQTVMIFISHFAFFQLLLWLLLCLLLLGWLNGHGNTINSVPMRKNNGQTHKKISQTKRLQAVNAETSTKFCLCRNIYQVTSAKFCLRRFIHAETSTKNHPACRNRPHALSQQSITAKLKDCISGLHSAQQPSKTHTSTELGGAFLGRGSSYQLLLMQSKTTDWHDSLSNH